MRGYGPAIKTSIRDITNDLEEPPCRIILKNEYEQPSGSFKLRGIGYLISTSIAEARRLGKVNVHVYCSSGGNAGLAAAYASKDLNVPCTVVLPTTSKDIVIKKLQSFGAEVKIHGHHWGEADNYLKELISNADESTYPVYCHPFDDPRLWDGHAAIIDEIIEEKQLSEQDLSKVAAIFCSVGGGGLYNGIVEGLQRREPPLSDVPIVVVETKQCPTFHEAIKAGKVVHLESINTIVTSLASPYLSEKSLENYHHHETKTELIDDLDAIMTTVDFYDKLGLTLEPSCSATLHFALNCHLLPKIIPNLKKDSIVLFIACGGSGVDESVIDTYRNLIKGT